MCGVRVHVHVHGGRKRKADQQHKYHSSYDFSESLVTALFLKEKTYWNLLSQASSITLYRKLKLQMTNPFISFIVHYLRQVSSQCTCFKAYPVQHNILGPYSKYHHSFNALDLQPEVHSCKFCFQAGISRPNFGLTGLKYLPSLHHFRLGQKRTSDGPT